MGVFSRRVILFPYPKAKADQPSRAQRGDEFDAEVKLGHWEGKHNKPGLWRKLTCRPNPPLPASSFFVDDPEWREAVGRLTTATDQLLIVGHCEANSTVIGCEDGTVALSGKDLCDLLADHLPQGFSGRIKIYACESGVGFERSSGSYADSFAAYAYRRWPSCTVVGYDEVVRLGGPGKFKQNQVPIPR